MTTSPKVKTVGTTNLQPGELIHMDFAFYNVTSIRGLTSMLTVLCEKTKMIWIFPTAFKHYPVRIIRFVLDFFHIKISSSLSLYGIHQK